MNSKWQKALSGLLKSARVLKYRATFSYPATAIILVGSLAITSFTLASPSSKYQIELLELASASGAKFDPIKAIETLAVKGRAPKTGYSRSAFGPAWADVDRNGCDTRNDILKRDLTQITFRAKTKDCIVEIGILTDPFSGGSINFQRGIRTSALVQIDHVVALSNAWQTGIFKSDLATRKSFANDPLNLLAVKGSLNSQKRDGDAATWLPPNKPFRCDYVSRQVEVKVKYNLWLTRAEKEAILRILSNPPCLKQN
ncbi:MAG: HNH endonuclease family protein [Candidatus Nanopelagicaceae bacterium]|nr:HNH endonuclease family protein [Candidatus Nanopelagicales bacterium]MDP5046101.1 HNH endonuclease family protein [Candidatus Nanopelagicaceae bacterium]